MKLNTILEDFDAAPQQTSTPKKTGGGLLYRDLTSLQLHYLNKIASGKLNLDDEIPDNVQDVLDELQSLRLLDDAYELTDAGNKAVHIFQKLGRSGELASAANRQAKLGYLNDKDDDNQSNDVDDIDDVDDNDFTDDAYVHRSKF